MPATFELDRPPILVVAALLLEGCNYYGCKDDLKRDYAPLHWQTRWQDASTLEVDFGGALRPPTEVDPRRFALLRYNVAITDGNSYYCYFDTCYRELGGAEAIPESLSWDPAKPGILRLHFAEPLPAGSCEPWPGKRTDFQALELIYLGVEGASYDETETGGDPLADPDQLAYADDRPIEELGPDLALSWLEGCFAGGACELHDFCVDRGGYEDHRPTNVWVDCLD